MLKRRGTRTDPGGTPFLRRHLLLLLFPVVRVKCDCQPSPRTRGPCVCQVAIAAACRWGSGAIQCRRLLWGQQTQLQLSYQPKSYPWCPVSAGWPGLQPTHAGTEESAKPRFESRPGVEYELRENGVQSRRFSWLQPSEGIFKLPRPKGLRDTVTLRCWNLP